MDSQLLNFTIKFRSDQQTNMDFTKSDKASADDAKVKSDLFNLVEKLQSELQAKNQELQVKHEKLAKEKQKMKNLSTDLALEKAGANRTTRELASAQEMIDNLQLYLWKSFPSSDLCYYIKAKVPSPSPLENVQYNDPYVDKFGQLRLRPAMTIPSQYKFTKNSNGTFSICEITKEKYLRTQNSSHFSRVIFSADEDNAEEFVLFFHPQNQQAGLLVDISSSAGYFLSMDNENYIVANSSNVPADKFKFLIIPVEEWW